MALEKPIARPDTGDNAYYGKMQKEINEWREWGGIVDKSLKERMMMRPPMQQEFNATIGELDRLISMMVECGKTPLDLFNCRTLKHHAEDMILAGRKILGDLGVPYMQA